MSLVPQYDSLFSVLFSIAALIPVIFLCIIGKRSKILNLLISGFLISTIVGTSSLQMIELLTFLCCEIFLIYFFLYFRKRCKSELAYYFIFFVSMLPIIVIRYAGHFPDFSEYIGFVGCSYICFKIWQILFEIHDGKITEIKIIDLLNFLLFFPSFSSGPIARYQPFINELNIKPEREKYLEQYFIPGIKSIFKGFVYKFAFAFLINTYIMAKIPEGITISSVILYMYAYTIYLFFDFAGYSLMAIGMGQLMGIRLPDNFNKPFMARNMKEFWTRWHMSLSTWFTDYVFGRFVLNNCRNGLFSSTRTAGRVASVFTMTLMGIWHGLAWNYILYGIYQGVLLLITDIYVKSKLYRKAKKKKYFDIISRIICFQFIAFGMLIFSGHFMN